MHTKVAHSAGFSFVSEFPLLIFMGFIHLCSKKDRTF